jgi:hypothetical protein
MSAGVTPVSSASAAVAAVLFSGCAAQVAALSKVRA